MTITRLVVAFLTMVALASSADAEWKIESQDKKTSIKFGFLGQFRAEFLETSDGEEISQNLFIRRFRVLAGGKIHEKLSFFFETDSPNIGKSGIAGAKTEEDIFVQDLIVSWNQSNAFNADVGLLLIENGYNSNQSAASLMATDYGPFTFVDSVPLGERVGRDNGVRARGYLADDHVEYRAGVYQGRREDESTNAFRYVVRGVYNVFEAQKGYFYQGTSLGKRKILSFGATYDTQQDYNAITGDIYMDLPVLDGDGVTFQVDWVDCDLSQFTGSFGKLRTLFSEFGYYFGSTRLLPFVQYSSRDFDDRTYPDDQKLQAGLGWMIKGHSVNLKFSVARFTRDGDPDRNEIWLNLQTFYF